MLNGNVECAADTLHAFHQISLFFDFAPEAYSLEQDRIVRGRNQYVFSLVLVDKEQVSVHAGVRRFTVALRYPLRPEMIESTYFLYRATSDPVWLDYGMHAVNSLNSFARTVYQLRGHFVFGGRVLLSKLSLIRA